ncbi:MAG: hypothetical protein NW241_22615 [Bacteroidia bacterium]|nr:hypothetical protein [Bacteroidia bacterium]
MDGALLIGESGSTKCEWRWCAPGAEAQPFRSAGLNPNILPEAAIDAAIRGLAAQLPGLPGQIRFYGSGISGPPQAEVLIRALAGAFPGAEARVHTDLLAAARATLRSEGLVLILGTGSNACRHAGGEVTVRRGGHGYLFGDEGSGADLGKAWLSALLYGELPADLADATEAFTGMPLLVFRGAVYRDARPNVRLASLAPLICGQLARAEVRALVQARMRLLVQRCVLPLAAGPGEPADIVGSVGHYFRGAVSEALEAAGVRAGQSIPVPADALVQYHRLPGNQDR